MKNTIFIMSLVLLLAVASKVKAETKTVQQNSNGPVYNFHFHNGKASSATAEDNVNLIEKDPEPILLPKRKKKKMAAVYFIGSTFDKDYDYVPEVDENGDYKTDLRIDAHARQGIGLKIQMKDNIYVMPGIFKSEMSIYTPYATYEGDTFGPSLGIYHQGDANFLGFLGLQGGLSISYAKTSLDRVSHVDWANTDAEISSASDLSLLAQIGLRMEFGDFSLSPSFVFGRSDYNISSEQANNNYTAKTQGANIEFEYKF